MKEIGDKITINDDEILKLQKLNDRKGAEKSKDLAPLALKAVKQVAVKENGKYIVDIEDIKVEKKEAEVIQILFKINH